MALALLFPLVKANIEHRYLEDMREYMNNLKELEPEGDSRKERRKVQKWIDEKRRHLRILIKYLDTDHAETKKR